MTVFDGLTDNPGATGATSNHRKELPFVCLKNDELDHWAVTPSGNDEQDFDTGIKYFWEALAIAEQCEDNPQLLELIARDMFKKGQYGYLESGFLHAMSRAAFFYHHALRWDHIHPWPYGEPIIHPGFKEPGK